MWRSLETRERRVFSESVYPFRAEPRKVYIYHQYTGILFILQYNLPKKNVIQFNEKKDNGNLIDTSIVFSVMGVA
jgi:hypothetical protein